MVGGEREKKTQTKTGGAKGRSIFFFRTAGILLLVGVFSPAIFSSGRAAQRKVTEPMAKAGAADEHEIKVLPIFFIPSDGKAPSPEQEQKLMKHVKWARQRYHELLGGTDTFEMAKDQVVVYKSKKPMSFYRAAPEGSTPVCLSEMLEYFKTNRNDAPYVFLILVMNSADKFPNGGGRPINGGHDNGGGVILMATYAMDVMHNFQSTLQHELGHSFGLLHPEAYGYDMETSPSIMSYNKAHHTHDFQPSPTPGIFIPEDLRALAMNKKEFPHFSYTPVGKISPKTPSLPPMDIPGQPAWSAR
jgi:hypothetical protein